MGIALVVGGVVALFLIWNCLRFAWFIITFLTKKK